MNLIFLFEMFPDDEIGWIDRVDWIDESEWVD